MSISFSCNCGYKLRAPDGSAGKRGKCGKCGAVVTVPDPDPLGLLNDKQLDIAADPVTPPPLPKIGAKRAEPEDDYDVRDDDIPLAKPATAAKPVRKTSSMPTAGLAPTVARSTAPSVPSAVGAAPMSSVRRYLYFLLILVFLPLAWSTLHLSQEERSVADRIASTLRGHPDIAERLDNMSDNVSKEEFLAALPDDRVEGALLPDKTWAHWGFAALSGAGFMAAVLVMFPTKQTRWHHLVGIGLLTGTLGIVLLLAFQFIAFRMPLFRGTGWVTLLLDLIWLIGQSYKMALGDYNFFLSFLGFTAGVGFCEEVCKALPLAFKARGSGFASWRSAMLWGLVSGVGFGVSEGITYSSEHYNGIYGGEIYLVRFVSCVGLHAIWAAAIGITIFRRQDHFRGEMNPFEWLFCLLQAVIVPMVLHGLYDTLLKKDYEAWALVVAVASFAWLAFQIERAERHFTEDETGATVYA